MEKVPLVVNDGLGFYISRTISEQLNEAAQMVAEGIHPQRIDDLGRAVGMPVGPLTLLDEVSLRLNMEVKQTQIEMGLKKPEEELRPQGVQLIAELVTEHYRGGRHHGDGGLYDYRESGKSLWPLLLDRHYRQDLDVSDDDVKDRLLFSPVIECLKCLQSGVLRSVADGNVASLLGISAPIWTGGYIQFVNTYGLQNFIDRCNELSSKYGSRFTPPEIVRRKLASGETFN